MDHVRIDEGQKRPRKKTPAPMQHRPGTGRFAPKLPENLDDTAIFERIAAGERPSDIAKSLGVTPAALYIRYRGNAAYQQARYAGTGVRIDCAEAELEAAPDPLSLARAREVHRAVAWRASVEHPDAWGDKRHVTVELTGDLGDKLRRAKERVIEGESSAVLPNGGISGGIEHNANVTRDE